MNRFILILLLSLPLSLSAFTPPPSSIITDEEKHEKLLQFLEAKQFVLEANSLYDRYGRIAFVNPINNFFALSEEDAVVQVGFNNGRPGANGLGGFTLEGPSLNLK